MRTRALAVCFLAGVAGLASYATEAAPPPADSPGAALYRQRCQTCHAVDGRGSALGPPLAGVVGRRAGSAQFNYSAALRESGITWSRANLNTFLATPGRVVPGTRMVMGVPDAKQRTAIIDHMATMR